jgi:hypothetical protein
MRLTTAASYFNPANNSDSNGNGESSSLIDSTRLRHEGNAVVGDSEGSRLSVEVQKKQRIILGCGNYYSLFATEDSDLYVFGSGTFLLASKFF